MRQDEIETLAAAVASGLVVELVRLTGAPVPEGAARILADMAARDIRTGIASLTAVRVEAQAASVADLRTR